jgi:hypothetical protein
LKQGHNNVLLRYVQTQEGSQLGRDVNKAAQRAIQPGKQPQKHVGSTIHVHQHIGSGAAKRQDASRSGRETHEEDRHGAAKAAHTDFVQFVRT